MKKLISFYVYSSIHVAIAVVSLVEITVLQFGFPKIQGYIFFLFFATIAAYNAVKYGNKMPNKCIGWLTFISVCLGLYFGVMLPIDVLLFSVGGIVLIWMYAYPVYPMKKSLRQYGFLKLFVVVICWSGATFFLTLVYVEGYQKVLENTDFCNVFFSRMSFVFALIIPFEICDMKTDENKIKTVPLKIGMKRSKFLGCFIALLSLFLNFSYLFIPIVLLVLLSIVFANSNRHFYYTRLFVEAIPIIWLLLEGF